MAISPLPIFPGTRARESLPASQLATLNNTISSTLAQILALSPEKRDKATSVAFVSSYAKDHAQRILQSLIWETSDTRTNYLAKLSKVERTIHERAFRLSERLASELTVQALIDLAIVYGPTNSKCFRALTLSIKTNSQLIKELESEAVPAFASLLSSSAQGLYGFRKISYILWAFLNSSPPEFVRPFARNKDVIIALAKAYDDGLSVCVRSYGGIRPERLSQGTSSAALDDWERIFLETKVAFADSFHILLRTLLKDVEEVTEPGSALAARCEIAFEIVFALLELPSANETEPIPFLNQSLLADYQHTYNFSKLLSGATHRADDPRTELLESALQSLENGSAGKDPQARPGALKLLIRSSGVHPGIDNLGRGSLRVDIKGNGKAAVAPQPALEDDPAVEAAVAQVLDILPEYPPEYIRFVLSHPDYPFKGDAERLIGAILEGTAPTLADYEAAMATTASRGYEGVHDTSVKIHDAHDFTYTKERNNIFDGQAIELSQVHVGKKNDDAAVLQDRAFIEQMKADIVRRVEEMVDDDEEDGTNKGKGIEVAYEDELEDGALKVRDGEESDDGESDEADDDDENASNKPETILELAYIANNKLFDRDAETRRSKARNDLRLQTGWSDEQIEGWRIMLERDPNKDRILQKHEFAGNRRGPLVVPNRSAQPSGDGRGQGRGRGGVGRGRGRGRGRGGSNHDSEGGGGGGDSARDRAWKDKNKASRGNHNRKRGHDKKMARAGGPS